MTIIRQDDPEGGTPALDFAAVCRLLPELDVEGLLELAPALARLIPELSPLIGFDQRSPHHAYDLFTHVAHVVAGVPRDLTLRWAALLHDIGKIPTFTQDETGRGHFYGHAPRGAQMADAVLRRLEAPPALREQAVLLIRHHMTRLTPDRQKLEALAAGFGWNTVEQLLTLQEADMASKGTCTPEELAVFPQIRSLLEQLREEGGFHAYN